MHAGTHDIPGGARFRGHTHDTPHLVAVLAGGFSERDGKSARDVGPRSLRLSPGRSHDIDFGPDGARCLMIELAAEDLASPPGGTLFLEGDPWLAHLLGRLSRDVAESGRELHTDALILELLAQIERRRSLSERRSPTPPRWLLAVRERVSDEPSRPSLTQLAAEVGVHRVHVARAFRDHFGETLGDCARRHRLLRARALLLDSSLSLAEVAHRAGYADQSHLTRVVRQAFGATPARLRSVRTLPTFNTPPGGRL